MPFMVEAHILRSPHGHARIAGIDVAGALALKGVHAVVTAADLPPGLPPIPCRIPTHGDLQPYLQHVLAREKVRYVGEPVAVIVADTRALAEDAAELIEVEWEPLPVVTDPHAGALDDAEQIHLPPNLAGRMGLRSRRRRRARSSAAAFTVRKRSRCSATPPCRWRPAACSPATMPARNLLEIHGPTKIVHTNRNILANMLQMGEAEIRFIEPDVGGSFGARGEFYPEDFLIPWLAMQLRRPVRWIEDRSSISPRSTTRATAISRSPSAPTRTGFSPPSTSAWSPTWAPISAPMAMSFPRMRRPPFPGRIGCATTASTR